jgi:hypothetical protein
VDVRSPRTPCATGCVGELLATGVGVVLRPGLIAILLAASCDRRPFPREAEAQPAGPAECVRDDDCVLLPSALTCCVECPPAPPFEPAPSWVLGGMLVQNETDCAGRDRACPEVRCEPVPEGCRARAACAGGRCVAVTLGCELPTT